MKKVWLSSILVLMGVGASVEAQGPQAFEGAFNSIDECRWLGGEGAAGSWVRGFPGFAIKVSLDRNQGKLNIVFSDDTPGTQWLEGAGLALDWEKQKGQGAYVVYVLQPVPNTRKKRVYESAFSFSQVRRWQDEKDIPVKFDLRSYLRSETHPDVAWGTYMHGIRSLERVKEGFDFANNDESWNLVTCAHGLLKHVADPS